MVLKLTNWDDDFAVNEDEEYQALVRTLNFIEGFGLLFVRCSPAEGERIITKVREVFNDKNIEVLRLDKSVTNLYEKVDKLNNKENLKILFITGLHTSFYEYEESKKLSGWNTKDIYSYSWKGVPPILINLNQQRERFRDNFNICFVFLLPLFAIKYFIQRAPDFFDWRSGMFEFPTDRETLEQESSSIFPTGSYEKYINLTPEERNEKIIKIQELIAEDHQEVTLKSKLLLDLGNLLCIEQDYKEAINAYNEVIRFNPNFHEAWFNRGSALFHLEWHEEAITSYDQVLKIQPDNYRVWNNHGIVMSILGRYEEAIASYDQALKIQPDNYGAWNNRGNVLINLGKNEEAVTSFDRALEIQADDYEVWNQRGIALLKLKNNEEAIASFKKALEIQPDNYEAWFNRGKALVNLGKHEEAIASFNKALEIQPDKYEVWYNRGNALGNLGKYEEAIASFNKALELKPNYYKAWGGLGNVFYKLGSCEEAILSFSKVVKIQPDDSAWNNIGYLLLKNYSNDREEFINDKPLEISLSLYNFHNKFSPKDFETYKEALKNFNKALELKPEFGLAWANQGYSLYYLGRDEEALASFSQALVLEPNDYVSCFNQSFILIKLRLYDQAIASLNKGLKLKPDSHIAKYNKARIFALKGNTTLAIKNLKAAIKLNSLETRNAARNEPDFDIIRKNRKLRNLIV